MNPWPLPHPPAFYRDRLIDLHARIRNHLREVQSAAAEDFTAARQPAEGDTIFRLDEHADEIVRTYVAEWAEEAPVLLIAEGQPGDGGVVFPDGTPRERAAFTCIVDPIDGTRGLMYGKRSGWVLSGIAPAPEDGLPRLDQIVVAVQTELPTLRSHLSDVLWAATGTGAEAETVDLHSGARRPFRPCPSQAATLEYGFAAISKFLPAHKALMGRIEERLYAALLPGGEPQVFDDQYISTGGQLYELMMGHDRFVADLRAYLGERTGHTGLTVHPYDLCAELIAREAGVEITDERGGRLATPLDIRLGCSWAGYANPRLRASIEPVLQHVLHDEGL